jgi:hypothetical protein
MDWDKINREARAARRSSGSDSISDGATANHHIAKLNAIKNKRPLPTLDPEFQRRMKVRQAARDAVEIARRRVNKLARPPVSQPERREIERLCREAIEILNGPDLAGEYRPSIDSKLRYFRRKLEAFGAE